MHKVAFAILLVFIALGAGFGIDFEKAYPKPQWYDKTSLTEDRVVYAVGHSGQESSEQKAKDAALVSAVREFLKYCKISPEPFGRIIEIYSKLTLGEYSKLDPGAQELLRAKLFTSKFVFIEWYTLAHGDKFEAAALLKVPKAECDLMTAQKNTKISVDLFFYREDKNKMIQDFREGSIFGAGDKYAVYFKPSDNCYIYVYLTNDRGGAFRLFPNLLYETASNPVRAGEACWIPNTEWLLRLSGAKEKADLYVIVSLSRVAELEKDYTGRSGRKNLDKTIKRAKLRLAALADKMEVTAAVPPEKKGLGKVAVVKKLLSPGASIFKLGFSAK